MSNRALSTTNIKEARRKTWRKLYRDRQLYMMLLPAVLITFFLSYLPLPGILIGFQDFSIYKGILGSEWIGLDNFRQIFARSQLAMAVWNTLKISLLKLVITFPAPIILALMINEVRNQAYKRVTQTISYLPHFLSWISVVGLVQLLFGRDGLINDLRMFLGADERVTFLAEQGLFIWFVLGISLWKEVGWGTIVHLANLSSINPELYEAAEVDGAKHLQKLWYITLPHMLPTVTILLIFQMGTLFASNFELIYGLQNPYVDFEVISTIVYKTGLQNGDYSLSTAIGFAQSTISLLLVIGSNWISKKISGTGIF